MGTRLTPVASVWLGARLRTRRETQQLSDTSSGGARGRCCREPRKHIRAAMHESRIVAVAATMATMICGLVPSSLSAESSGQAMSPGHLTGWRRAFADNFAYENVPIGGFSRCSLGRTPRRSRCRGLPRSVAGKWWAYPDGWPGTPRTGTYFPSRTLSIENGVLDYYVHTRAVAGRNYHMIDAAVPKVLGGGIVYGRYVVRARWDGLRGYHVSFLLWPDSGRWPRDGEIDFPEADLNSSLVGAYVHWEATGGAGRQASYVVSANTRYWHTYEIDWLPDSVSFYLDGGRVGRLTSHVPRAPLHWVLQVGTSYSEAPPENSVAGHLQIKWAVVDIRPSIVRERYERRFTAVPQPRSLAIAPTATHSPAAPGA